MSRLPLTYNARNLFNTPGAGTSNPPGVDRAIEAPAAGESIQPRATDPPHLNLSPPQHVPMPPGHFSNPLDNMIAAATRLAALLAQDGSPSAMEIRRAGELLQTAVAQQAAYSYSRDRIHSTPRPSRSYSRHIDELAMSSSEWHRNQPRRPNPLGAGNDAQILVDQGRARHEAELVAQLAAQQQSPVYPLASAEVGVTSRTLGVPCLLSALCNERFPKDSKGPRKVPNYTGD